MNHLKKQRNLDGVSKRALRWGSHIPLHTAILRVFPIEGVVELGAGYNSTPLFFASVPNVVSIESDKGWIEKMRADAAVVEDETHKLVHHEVPEHYYRGTHIEDIEPKIMKDSIKFFKSFKDGNLLFIDCYAGFRLEALVKMHKNFDVITYHDAEPLEDHHYLYSTFKAGKDYLHFVDRTFLANTGFLIHKKFEHLLPEFEAAYAEEAAKYAAKYSALHVVTLEPQG